jgi:hypothetical protein
VVRLSVVLGGIALLMTAAAYALFMDSGSGTGSVMAGTLDLKLVSTGDPQDNIFTFIWDGTCNKGNLAVGETCTVSGVGVRNLGNLTFDYSFSEYVDPASLSNCYDVTVTGVMDDDSGLQQHMPPGDEETFTMQLTVPPTAPDSCQGQTANVGVTLTAVQDANPHSTADSH